MVKEFVITDRTRTPTDVVNSGGKNRVAVDSFVSNTSANPIPVSTTGGTIPKFAQLNNTSVAAGTEQDIVNYTGSGTFDFISVHSGTNGAIPKTDLFELILVVDGTEVYRVSRDFIKEDMDLDTNTIGMFAHDGDGITDQYSTPVSFTTSLKVMVKNLDTVTANFAGIVRYRI